MKLPSINQRNGSTGRDSWAKGGSICDRKQPQGQVQEKGFHGAGGDSQAQDIYHRGSMHFFAFDSFVRHTFQGKDEDFSQKGIKAIEFSNYQWSE